MKACIHVLGDAGYVWDADVAHWLRLECGIVGAMVGGVAAFKQQNAVHGLPLELSAEEVTLAVEKGWAELAPTLDTAALAAALGGGGRKRGRQSAYQYYEDEDDLDAEMADAAAQQQQQQQPAAEPTWRPALASGAAFVIPTTVPEATAANEGRSLEDGADGADGSAAAEAAASGTTDAAAAAGTAGAPGAAARASAGAAEAAAGGGAAAQWSFPATREERHRYWVFRDLHSRGYRLTGGSKFGADYLIYPGDPTLYHAQFCVRLLPYRQPITPSMLASATRGSHQARKHLLIASVTEDADEAAAGSTLAAAEGAAPQPAQQQQQAAEQQAAEASNGADVGPLAEQQEEAGSVQLGLRAGGVGSRGERYRIHYMTIGPVEGFGG
ncbi:tRNA-splicing endonuclease subunit Sen34 [Chlorella sorokiniana]|uniref:tRNA-intron lyase n=1 Tax=Chlorella sorokiniana TaxID=3076 RepID=A0A2P6TJ27_CHLSO|nr:tRNA-splicing endonuclease subunit Sen34 [Chlorella sorokiniana]|eukprot:PRW39237.1 tRNA-splicing endonuclease subunit Sen34 [Chlorella sorokiniana]